jgi:ABC-type uncharacterized transport system substrate-binding protein
VIKVVIKLLGVLWLGLSIWQQPAWSADKKSVLVIQSYHASYPWDMDYTQALRQQLADVTELSFVQLDTKRLPRTAFEQQAERAWQRFLELKPDLVVVGDDNALQLLGQRLVDSGTPVVYLGINNNPRNYFERTPANITGVLERPLFKRSIIHIRQILQGELSKVLVLFDDGTTSRALLAEDFGGLVQNQVGPVQVDIRLLGKLEEWQQAINQAPEQGYDAIIVGLYHTLVDEAGDHVPDQQLIQWSSQQSALPLFAYWKFAVGEQMTIGGYVLDGFTQGLLAADLVKEALAGKPLKHMPHSSGEGRFVFSRAQLQKWRIQLPRSIADQSLLLP